MGAAAAEAADSEACAATQAPMSNRPPRLQNGAPQEFSGSLGLLSFAETRPRRAAAMTRRGVMCLKNMTPSVSVLVMCCGEGRILIVSRILGESVEKKNCGRVLREG
jgi:hypothetical protein